jgi:hypothetical protein
LTISKVDTTAAVSGTVWGDELALLLIESDAVRTPFALGVYVMNTLQLDPAPRMAGQLWLNEKSDAFAPVN